jgi:MSHA biogenesis protein MshO
MRFLKTAQHGFTLIELIMVIVITGILSAIVAVFLKTPVDEYIDVARRAALTDIADTALRRIGRDIALAVPNSVRVPSSLGASYIEFIPTRTGGRYRANAAGGSGLCSTAGDELSFTSADTCFEITGEPITFVAGDSIVIGSTQANGNPPYDNTTSGVLRAYTGAVGSQSKVQFTATQFPAFAQLPSQRFDVVSASEQAVTYACNGLAAGVLDTHGDGQGELRRYWAYGFNATQFAPAALGVTGAVLATKVSGCSIDYSNVNQRNGLVAIHLTLTSGGESISLYSETHVNNMP